jgi:glycosyltransferase involved in cell wall biosynthesis
MKQILWLTSWYPNPQDRMNGDFIQRHARAAALFCRITVIHVEKMHPGFGKEKIIRESSESPMLSEHSLLYRTGTAIPVLSSLLSYLNFLRIFKKEINAYIRHQGLPDLVHVQIPVRAGILALWLQKKYRIPFVVTEHWAIYNDSAPDRYSGRSFLFKYFSRRIFKKASLFLPVSRDLGDAVCSRVTPVKFSVIPNSVDTAYFNFRPGKKSLPFTFLHVSTMTWQKNTEAILRAFSLLLKIHPDSRLVLTGAPGEQLKILAQELGIPAPCIRFTGLVSYPGVAALMQESHALVLFSRYENLPCVVLEALCCGLPVIASDVGGIREIITPENGYLVASGDEEALLGCMLDLLSGYWRFNPARIAETGAAAFGYAAIGRQIFDHYQNLLKKTPS